MRALLQRAERIALPQRAERTRAQRAECATTLAALSLAPSAATAVATLAIFSSTGADAKLNALIFGESVLNDAVAIVLFKTIAQVGATTPLAAEGLSALSSSQVFGAIGSFCLSAYCSSAAPGHIQCHAAPTRHSTRRAHTRTRNA